VRVGEGRGTSWLAQGGGGESQQDETGVSILILTGNEHESKSRRKESRCRSVLLPLQGPFPKPGEEEGLYSWEKKGGTPTARWGCYLSHFWNRKRGGTPWGMNFIQRGRLERGWVLSFQVMKKEKKKRPRPRGKCGRRGITKLRKGLSISWGGGGFVGGGGGRKKQFW